MTTIRPNNTIEMVTVTAITVILFPDTVGIIVVPVEVIVVVDVIIPVDVIVAVISIVVVAVGKYLKTKSLPYHMLDH